MKPLGNRKAVSMLHQMWKLKKPNMKNVVYNFKFHGFLHRSKVVDSFMGLITQQESKHRYNEIEHNME